MKESVEKRTARLATIIQRLRHYYPDAHCALDHGSPLELLVATILSAQCTDARVNLTTPALFRRYRTAADYADAEPAEMEALIKPTGFYRAKAKSLRGMGQGLVEKFGGEVPNDLDGLVALPGVGRKTANVVLGNAFGKAAGIVVDTHVKRLAFRLGLSRALTPEKVEVDLLKITPEAEWVMLPHLLIFHGRQICKARRPQCEVCPIEGECPKKGVLTPKR